MIKRKALLDLLSRTESKEEFMDVLFEHCDIIPRGPWKNYHPLLKYISSHWEFPDHCLICGHPMEDFRCTLEICNVTYADIIGMDKISLHKTDLIQRAKEIYLSGSEICSKLNGIINKRQIFYKLQQADFWRLKIGREYFYNWEDKEEILEYLNPKPRKPVKLTCSNYDSCLTQAAIEDTLIDCQGCPNEVLLSDNEWLDSLRVECQYSYNPLYEIGVFGR